MMYRNSGCKPLTTILAEMLRSALAWEEEHRTRLQGGESEAANSLTSISRGLYTGQQEIAQGGKHNDDHNGNQKHQSPDDL